MKANRIENSGRNGRLAVVLAAAAVCLAAAGLAFGYSRLRALYVEQSVITDMAAQVSITAGKMVRPDVIADELGLRPGANLALIDFTARREALLRKIPTLRAAVITRHLPDRVSVVTEERTPVARLEARDAPSGRVVDAEGVVFVCQRGTRLLPAIVEPQGPGLQPGQRLEGRMHAALTLLETCRESEYADLNPLEVSTAPRDVLRLTLGDYDRTAILWEQMDEPPTAASRAALTNRLALLCKARRNALTPGRTDWDATLPDRVTANPRGGY